jgi:GT2 family glycosyltransferase
VIDTILLTDIGPAVHLLDSDLRIGVLGAKAYHPSGKPRPSAGHFPKARRLWYFRGLWSNPKGFYGPRELDAHRVDWVEGSFLMTTAENWVTSGGYDENSFYYGNDINFCRTTSERGLR